MKFSKNPFLKVRDFAVSQEIFELKEDKQSGLLKTHPFPASEDLLSYYESDDYISHTDSKKNLFEKLYHWVKIKTLKKKVYLIEYWNVEKGRVLDFGAGTGDFLCCAKTRGWKTIGFEPNEKAKGRGREKGLCYADKLEDFENHFFDVITLWHVLEHLPDPQKQIQELKKLLKPDGTLIVAVPNFKSFDARYYREYWAAYDVPRHLWHFSRKAVQTLFGNENMKVKKVLPMYYDSFYVSLLSEKYKTGRMNFIKAFYIGLLSNFKAKRSGEYSSLIYVIKNI